MPRFGIRTIGALQRHHEAEQARTEAVHQSAALLADFSDRMRRLQVAPIPIGFHYDLGPTGLLGHRRATSFQQKETGWVLPRKLDGMFVTTAGRLFKGPTLCVMRPGQKKTDSHPYVSFHFPPQNGFAFCFNHTQSSWSAPETWTVKEVQDAARYVADLAAALTGHGA
ncbi:hypothetical protein [Arthrobacter mobilis]|uniref:Uncharacterized protein n=1 Tax=Arthrobacter mobilis TaxID=2724944 RepID=A0A7X6K514_9MICC|nr:hypothetical protein [Arthrobacter mobilis]NKX55972.1 hypothetical protein [Arthrobacter mobilis]